MDASYIVIALIILLYLIYLILVSAQRKTIDLPKEYSQRDLFTAKPQYSQENKGRNSQTNPQAKIELLAQNSGSSDMPKYDIDWFAVDRDGNLAVFYTDGVAPLPKTSGRVNAIKISDWFHNATIEEIDFTNVYHEKGFYEYISLHNNQCHVEDVYNYQRINSPLIPATTADFPPEIALMIKETTLHDVCFAENESITIYPVQVWGDFEDDDDEEP